MTATDAATLHVLILILLLLFFIKAIIYFYFIYYYYYYTSASSNLHYLTCHTSHLYITPVSPVLSCQQRDSVSLEVRRQNSHLLRDSQNASLYISNAPHRHSLKWKFVQKYVDTQQV